MKRFISFILIIIVLFAVCTFTSFAFDANDYDYNGSGEDFFGDLFDGENSYSVGGYSSPSDSGGMYEASGGYNSSSIDGAFDQIETMIMRTYAILHINVILLAVIVVLLVVIIALIFKKNK